MITDHQIAWSLERGSARTRRIGRHRRPSLDDSSHRRLTNYGGFLLLPDIVCLCPRNSHSAQNASPPHVSVIQRYAHSKRSEKCTRWSHRTPRQHLQSPETAFTPPRPAFPAVQLNATSPTRTCGVERTAVTHTVRQSIGVWRYDTRRYLHTRPAKGGSRRALDTLLRPGPAQSIFLISHYCEGPRCRSPPTLLSQSGSALQICQWCRSNHRRPSLEPSTKNEQFMSAR